MLGRMLQVVDPEQGVQDQVCSVVNEFRVGETPCTVGVQEWSIPAWLT
jgi:hypothetical protein